MTSLIVWVGVDSRGSASLYLATDSRVTYSVGRHWSAGRKIFVPREQPDLLGFVGDVQHASQVLSQAVALLDRGLLYAADAAPDERLAGLHGFISEALSSVPPEVRAIPVITVYCTREGTGLGCRFRVARLVHSLSQKTAEWIAIPTTSRPVLVDGSGGKSIDKWNERWTRSDAGGTSRAVFAAFCDALRSGEDPLTGGSPQLAGLYREGPPLEFGVVQGDRAFFAGVPLRDAALRTAVPWRNELFEICDAHTLQRAAEAQPQPRPRSV